jgi:hypothetical protein
MLTTTTSGPALSIRRRPFLDFQAKLVCSMHAASPVGMGAARACIRRRVKPAYLGRLPRYPSPSACVVGV